MLLPIKFPLQIMKRLATDQPDLAKIQTYNSTIKTIEMQI